MLGEANVYANIAVSDIERAKQFYGETLGLHLQSENPGGVIYKSGNTMIFVYPSSNAGTNQSTAASWVVNNVTAAVEDLKSKGVIFERYDDMPGITRQDDIHFMGDFQAAWFKDPDGTILNISNSME